MKEVYAENYRREADHGDLEEYMDEDNDVEEAPCDDHYDIAEKALMPDDEESLSENPTLPSKEEDDFWTVGQEMCDSKTYEGPRLPKKLYMLIDRCNTKYFQEICDDVVEDAQDESSQVPLYLLGEDSGPVPRYVQEFLDANPLWIAHWLTDDIDKFRRRYDRQFDGPDVLLEQASFVQHLSAKIDPTDEKLVKTAAEYLQEGADLEKEQQPKQQPSKKKKKQQQQQQPTSAAPTTSSTAAADEAPQTRSHEPNGILPPSLSDDEEGASDLEAEEGKDEAQASASDSESESESDGELSSDEAEAETEAESGRAHGSGARRGRGNAAGEGGGEGRGAHDGRAGRPRTAPVTPEAEALAGSMRRLFRGETIAYDGLPPVRMREGVLELEKTRGGAMPLPPPTQDVISRVRADLERFEASLPMLETQQELRERTRVLREDVRALLLLLPELPEYDEEGQALPTRLQLAEQFDMREEENDEVEDSEVDIMKMIEEDELLRREGRAKEADERRQPQDPSIYHSKLVASHLAETYGAGGSDMERLSLRQQYDMWRSMTKPQRRQLIHSKHLEMTRALLEYCSLRPETWQGLSNYNALLGGPSKNLDHADDFMDSLKSEINGPQSDKQDFAQAMGVGVGVNPQEQPRDFERAVDQLGIKDFPDAVVKSAEKAVDKKLQLEAFRNRLRQMGIPGADTAPFVKYARSALYNVDLGLPWCEVDRRAVITTIVRVCDARQWAYVNRAIARAFLNTPEYRSQALTNLFSPQIRFVRKWLHELGATPQPPQPPRPSASRFDKRPPAPPPPPVTPEAWLDHALTRGFLKRWASALRDQLDAEVRLPWLCIGDQLLVSLGPIDGAALSTWSHAVAPYISRSEWDNARNCAPESLLGLLPSYSAARVPTVASQLDRLAQGSGGYRSYKSTLMMLNYVDFPVLRTPCLERTELAALLRVRADDTLRSAFLLNLPVPINMAGVLRLIRGLPEPAVVEIFRDARLQDRKLLVEQAQEDQAVRAVELELEQKKQGAGGAAAAAAGELSEELPRQQAGEAAEAADADASEVTENGSEEGGLPEEGEESEGDVATASKGSGEEESEESDMVEVLPGIKADIKMVLTYMEEDLDSPDFDWVQLDKDLMRLQKRDKKKGKVPNLKTNTCARILFKSPADKAEFIAKLSKNIGIVSAHNHLHAAPAEVMTVLQFSNVPMSSSSSSMMVMLQELLSPVLPATALCGVVDNIVVRGDDAAVKVEFDSHESAIAAYRFIVTDDNDERDIKVAWIAPRP
jgi:hypothetical protein